MSYNKELRKLLNKEPDISVKIVNKTIRLFEKLDEDTCNCIRRLILGYEEYRSSDPKNHNLSVKIWITWGK